MENSTTAPANKYSGDDRIRIIIHLFIARPFRRYRLTLVHSFASIRRESALLFYLLGAVTQDGGWRMDPMVTGWLAQCNGWSGGAMHGFVRQSSDGKCLRCRPRAAARAAAPGAAPPCRPALSAQITPLCAAVAVRRREQSMGAPLF